MIKRERERHERTSHRARKKCLKNIYLWHLIKDCSPKIHKGLLKRNSKETNTLVVKMGERSEHLIKEDIQIIWKDVPHHFSCGKGKLKQQGDTNVLHRSVCLTPCDPIDCSPTGSSVHGVFQARIPVWVAISYSRGSSRPGIKPTSFESPALAGRFFTTASPGKPKITLHPCQLMVNIQNTDYTKRWNRWGATGALIHC